MSTKQLSAATAASAGKPNAKLDHGYAVVRVDDYLGEDVPLDQRVTVKAVLRDFDAATREAERLNGLKGGGSRYVVQTTRVERPGPSADTANRLGRLPEPPLSSPEPTPDLTAFLESITIGENIWHHGPGRLNFPQFRVFETVRRQTAIQRLRLEDGLTVSLIAHAAAGHVDLVVLAEPGDGVSFRQRIVSFAGRVYADLCDRPLGEMTPLDMVERVADRFGLPLLIGTTRAKFFHSTQITVPSLRFGIAPDILRVDNPGNRDFVMASFVKIMPPATVSAGLAFCVDTAAYRKWVDGHDGPTVRAR